MSTTVFHGGLIVREFSSCSDIDTPHAIAIRDGVIVAENDEALALSHHPGATIIDLEDGALVPAFGDGHAHPLLAGLEAFGPALRQCRTVDEIVDAVATWAGAHPDQPWIVGASYDSTLVPGGVFDARWLDRAVADRPVVLRAWDYHTVWANSAALEVAGITAESPEPPFGRIVRRADGTPTGTLREIGAVDLIMRHAPTHSRQTTADALRIASRAFLDRGITWIQEAWVEEEQIDGWVNAAIEGALEARFNHAFRVDPLRWHDQVATFVSARAEIAEVNTPFLNAGTVKFFVDGVIENRTASLEQGYRGDADDRGLPNWTTHELTAAAQAMDEHGFQLHLHAIGDTAVSMALDAIEAVAAHNGPRDRRPVIAHVQLVSPRDIERFAALGVVANFQPLWSQLDPGMLALTLPLLPESYRDQQYRIRSLEEAGAVVSFGSDWPVTDLDWRMGSAVAISRETPEGHPTGGWMPEERLGVASALRAYTTGVAHQGFIDDGGRIALGYRADVVWLDRDPRAVPPNALPGVTIRGTWVAGRHHAPSDPPQLPPVQLVAAGDPHHSSTLTHSEGVLP